MKKKNKMMFLKILFYIFIMYFTVSLIVYFYQSNLMYNPGENNYLNEDSLNHKIEKVYIKSDQNLIGWYYKKNKNFKTLLFFHGNAGKLDNRIYKLNEFANLDLNYLIIAYRGFSGNEGEPTEKGIYQDAKAAKKWLNLKNINDKNIILYGESLGAAVAVDLAKNNQFSGIILESPFTSMTTLAKKYYPYLPVKIILKDKYETIKKIQKINCPILIMHGLKDTIVPFEMSIELFEKANEPKFKYFNDIDDHMMDFNNDLLTSIKSFIYNLN